MSAKIRIMVRVVKRRMTEGEDIEAILESWPKLTEEEKQEIRNAV